MFKLEIKRLSDNKITHGAEFPTIDEVNTLIARVEGASFNQWGKNGPYEKIITDRTLEVAAQETESLANAQELQQLKQYMINLDIANVSNLADVKEVLRKLAKAIVRIAK